MARKLKIHYEGAVYHVMLRGNYRQPVFLEHAHYCYFYKLIDRVHKDYGCKVHLFCLMTNHVHMVIEIGRIPISKIMQLISNCYTRYMNKKLDRMGHLFQGRYRSKLIQDDGYLIELCRYVHMNPLQAGMVEKLEDYRWSSHLSYLGRCKLSWLKKSLVITTLRNAYGDDFEYYSFVECWSNNEKPKFLKFEDGEIQVCDTINLKVCKRSSISIDHLSVIDIAFVVCQVTEVDFDKLATQDISKRLTLARVMIAYFCHYYASHQLNDIALFLDRNPQSLSKTMSRYLSLDGDRKITDFWIKKIEKALLLKTLS